MYIQNLYKFKKKHKIFIKKQRNRFIWYMCILNTREYTIYMHMILCAYTCTYIYMDILHAYNVNVNTYIYERNMCELSIYIIYNLYIYIYICVNVLHNICHINGTHLGGSACQGTPVTKPSPKENAEHPEMEIIGHKLHNWHDTDHVFVCIRLDRPKSN